MCGKFARHNWILSTAGKGFFNYFNNARVTNNAHTHILVPKLKSSQRQNDEVTQTKGMIFWQNSKFRAVFSAVLKLLGYSFLNSAFQELSRFYYYAFLKSQYSLFLKHFI